MARYQVQSDIHKHCLSLTTNRIILIISMILMGAFTCNAKAASVDLGNGFIDHGVATPISNHRGTVATVDGDGRDVALVWLFDHRGGYALLMIDAETGKSESFPIPFDNVKGDTPFASILSSGNKYYSHYGDEFLEFDPVKRAFTFHHTTTPQMAMGMTEDDNGVIWSVTYPDSGVVSYNPKTREFRDYGSVYKQNWNQYQRFVAADDAGWIYFGMGATASQIVALDPATSTAKPLLSEDLREKGTAHVYRDMNGKVYGQAHEGDGQWYEMYKGEKKKVGKPGNPKPKPIITGNQTLFYKKFPDGKMLEDVNLVDRKLTVFDPATSNTKTVSFDYESEGAITMGAATAPDGTICGGTAFPMRFFSYNPATDKMINRAAYGQWNTLTALKDKFFVGGYPRGYLLEWTPSQPWVPTENDRSDTNPQFLTQVSPVIHRPHSLLALADESMVIMGGTPEYGYTGGGLLFWDRDTKTSTVIEDMKIVPDQSTFALIELPGKKLLAGTTTEPGTGGEKKAKEAMIYAMDIATKKVLYRKTLIPGVQTYLDFEQGPNGLIYGIADKNIFFVYDPVKQELVHKEDVSASLGQTVSAQGPRIFVQGDNALYVLFVNGIATVDPATYKLTMIAQSPVKLEGGGAYLNGRVYFITSSHLCSYGPPKTSNP